jgi:glutathione S-transferase/RNA polymerase-associated protein
MKLFDNPVSPYAFKVRATLYEKGIDFEKCEIRRQDQRTELLRVSPRGEVPALQDGDTVVYDSRIICDYLEEKFPSPPLVPAAPADRARCRALELVSDTQVDACVFVLAMFKIFRPSLATEQPQAFARTQEILTRHHANLEKQLRERDYLLGDFSRADLALIPHLAAAAFIGHAVGGDYPRLASWVARVNERASVQRATQEAVTEFQQSHGDANGFFSNDRLHWRNDRIEAAVRVGLGTWLLGELGADRAFLSPVP